MMLYSPKERENPGGKNMDSVAGTLIPSAGEKRKSPMLQPTAKIGGILIFPRRETRPHRFEEG